MEVEVEPEATDSRVRVLAIWEAHAALAWHDAEGYFAAEPGTDHLVAVDRMTPMNPAWTLDRPSPPRTFTPDEPRGWVMRLEVLPPG